MQATPNLASCTTTGIAINSRFKRILVAVDFSKTAVEVLRVAVNAANTFSSQLYVVHAASMLVFAAPEAGPLPIDILDAELESAKARLQDLICTDPQLDTMKPEVVAGYAAPVDLIQQVTRDQHIDLVVIGSRGMGGISRLALGSVAEAVLRKSTCPVMIVGPHCAAEGNPFSSILLATKLTHAGQPATRYAVELAENSHGTLTVLHVVEPANPLSVVEENGNASQQLESALSAEPPHHCTVKTLVESGDAADHIIAVACQEGASLLVVGLKDRSGFSDRAPWSTLSRIIRELPCPVLGIQTHLRD